MPRVDLKDPNVFHDNYRQRASRIHELMTGERGVQPDFHIHYCWAQEQFKVRNRALALVKPPPFLNLQDGMKILIVGAGFGWLQEALQPLLPNARIRSIDTSPWVHTVKGTDETAEIDQWLDDAGITNASDRANWRARLVRSGPRDKVGVLNEDMVGPSRGRVKQALGLQGNAKADWGITEQVLPWLTDAEAQVLSEAMHSVCASVAHILTPFAPSTKTEPGPLWNWKHINRPGEPTRPDLSLQPWYTTTNWKALLPDDAFLSVHNYRVQ